MDRVDWSSTSTAGVTWVARCCDDVMRCGWLRLFYAYLLFLKNEQLGCWPLKVTTFWIAADREKGGASWLQVGLLAQSLPRRRSRRACVCAYVHVVRVCVHICMYVYVQTCIHVYMCMCIYICIRVHVYTCVYVCVCIFVHRM